MAFRSISKFSKDVLHVLKSRFRVRSQIWSFIRCFVAKFSPHLTHSNFVASVVITKTCLFMSSSPWLFEYSECVLQLRFSRNELLTHRKMSQVLKNTLFFSLMRNNKTFQKFQEDLISLGNDSLKAFNPSYNSSSLAS